MNRSTWMWIFAGLLPMVVAAAGSGCALWLPPLGEQSLFSSRLQPLVNSRDAIDLEVYFVDRRIGDPLIGEGLWSSLHAVTAVDPEIREHLGKDGFRFAMSPSRPPRPLQALMALSDDHDPSRRATMRRYTLPTGQETYLLTSTIPNGVTIERRGPGESKPVEIQQGNCLLRLQAERVEDGWAKLVIVPEIRHGSHQLRPRPTAQDWLYDQGQEVLAFYEDRLSAEVNVGEILVLGLAPSGKDALAGHFFRGDASQGIERLILIRVADMRKVAPIRVTD